MRPVALAVAASCLLLTACGSDAPEQELWAGPAGHTPPAATSTTEEITPADDPDTFTEQTALTIAREFTDLVESGTPTREVASRWVTDTYINDLMVETSTTSWEAAVAAIRERSEYWSVDTIVSSEVVDITIVPGMTATVTHAQEVDVFHSPDDVPRHSCQEVQTFTYTQGTWKLSDVDRSTCP